MVKAGEDQLLEEKYQVCADVWSVTSYKELYTDAIECERWNLLNPGKKPKQPYIANTLDRQKGVFVAATDYAKVLPSLLSRWIPGRLAVLGTDGFGRSDSRAALRNFFEVDARYIALAALNSLAAEGNIDAKVVQQAVKELDIDPGKLNPHVD